MPEENSSAPAPESLETQSQGSSSGDSGTAGLATLKANLKPRRGTYKPSHKSTFIALAVVALILIVNGVVIWFILRGNGNQQDNINRSEVTLSSETLSKLGVERNSVSDQGTELTIGPSSKFNSKVAMNSDLTVAGQLILNNTFSATDASLAKLKAGNTDVAQLNVNGDGTISTLNLRKDLNVVGASKFQGPVTLGQLLTVNNNVNIVGNLAVGGTISVRNFQASSLISDTTLTIGGHVITRGNAPGASAGPGVGSNGTVSVSGNDASGTVAVNIGVGASPGILANVSFNSAYSNTPHVVVTAIGPGPQGVYVNRNSGGFSIGVTNALGPGGYAFDYIVMQ
ncbi:MAG: hypothetical protein WBB39_00265 [Candidatus Saccharimonadales bacterium]